MCVENLIEARRHARQQSLLTIAWQPPPVRVQRTHTNSVTVSRPARDLIPCEVFARWHSGQKPEDLGLPIATIFEDGVPVYRGLLVRAENWNPPEECFRINCDTAFAFSRGQARPTSTDELVAGSTEELWKSTCSEFANASSACGVTDKVLKDATPEVQAMYAKSGPAGAAPPSSGVFGSIAALTEFVLQKQRAQSAEQVPQLDPNADTHLLGACAAAERTDFSGLMDDAGQIGAFFGAAPVSGKTDDSTLCSAGTSG